MNLLEVMVYFIFLPAFLVFVVVGIYGERQRFDNLIAEVADFYLAMLIYVSTKGLKAVLVILALASIGVNLLLLLYNHTEEQAVFTFIGTLCAAVILDPDLVIDPFKRAFLGDSTPAHTEKS